MIMKAIAVLITAFSALLINATHIETSLHLEEPSPSLYDDIRLTPEQEQEMRERGFYTAGKWPKVNGVVTVPYYIDSTSFPAGDPFRAMFKSATDIYRQNTCIEWVEVPKSDTRHKVRIFKDNGCYSNLGMAYGDEQVLSLGDGCHTIGTMIHEMGHCMGLYHTQSRPDRDQFVKPWLKNVQPGMEGNFEKSTADTFNIPYDYKSMMHYGLDYFSINGSFTLTTFNPNAMFAIGSRPDTFRNSDSAFLNKGYECIAEFTKKCGAVSCLNGGFVGKNCKCQCPENTSGTNCGTVNGPLFSDKPTCGGDVTTAGTIVPKGYPTASTRDKCIFVIKAPNCKVPTITFTEVKFYWNICGGNMLSTQVSPVSYGYTWCDAAKVPLGKTIKSESQFAMIYYYTGAAGFQNLGFKANVQFVDDPQCSG